MVAFILDHGEYERWLRAARETLRSAHGDMERGDYNWACFKVQQAAEQGVEGLLHGIGVSAYGHSVSRLLGILSQHIPVPPEIVEAAKRLDKLYIPTRYPNAWHGGCPASTIRGEMLRRL